MAGGFIAGVQSPGVSYNMNTAVTYAGTLLSKNTVANEMDLTATQSRPDGYAVRSSEDAFGVAKADVQLAVAPLITGNVVEIPLLATNVVIAVGDLMETTALGTIDKKSGAGWVVGTALETAAQNDGAAAATAHIKVLLNVYYASS
jgi:hypothetical protein